MMSLKNKYIKDCLLNNRSIIYISYNSNNIFLSNSLLGVKEKLKIDVKDIDKLIRIFKKNKINYRLYNVGYSTVDKFYKYKGDVKMKRFNSYEDCINSVSSDYHLFKDYYNEMLRDFLNCEGGDIRNSIEIEPNCCFIIDINNKEYYIGVTGVFNDYKFIDYYWIEEV